MLRQQALRTAGQVIPANQNCSLLIDTGASGTSIDPSIITTLGLAPTGNIPIQTPSTGGTPHFANTYDISMIILGPGIPKIIPAMQIVGLPLRHQGIDGLLGRDVLASARLIYSGTDNIVMMSL
jgi:hypothetical protein